MADPSSPRSLAHQRPLLSAAPRARRSQESGISHRRRHQAGNRLPVDFAAGVTTAVLSAATFIAVLWTIGGSLSFSLAGIEITIPGFLVVAAVAYAVVASGSMVFIGHRFVTVSEKNQSEAEFRYVLTRLSENGESIALGGEDEERDAVATR